MQTVPTGLVAQDGGIRLAHLHPEVATAFSGGAVDSAVVHLAGAETIAGVKTFSSQPVLPQKLTAGTAVATTAGTFVDFTGIPAWVNRITVLLNAVSTNGTSGVQVQIGNGAAVTTGYNSYAGFGAAGGSSAASATTTGFPVTSNNSASSSRIGIMSICRLSGNTWVANYVVADGPGTVVSWGAGVIALAGALDRVRLTTVNGTDVFDAGSVNILYE